MMSLCKEGSEVGFAWFSRFGCTLRLPQTQLQSERTGVNYQAKRLLPSLVRATYGCVDP